MLIGMIGRAHQRNKIILALVISVCLAVTLYSLGLLTAVD